MEPVEAAPRRDVGAALHGLGLRTRNADAVGDHPRLPVDEDREVGVNVGDGLLLRLALDPVDGLPGRPR